MSRKTLTSHISLILLLLTLAFKVAAQENHIQFNVVNDTAQIEAVIEEHSLGTLIH